MESELRSIVDFNSLRHTVGATIFCPGCDHILDVRRAVEASLWAGTPPEQGTLVPTEPERCVGVRCLCGPCWDKVAPNLLAAAAERGVRVETIDGRLLTACAG